jgi:UDP-glucose 4-epimerase
MRVMVTGGAGYIGSLVVEGLLQEGHQVVVYDSLVKGHRDAVPEAATFVQGDLLDEPALSCALRDHGCTAVVHMAAHSLVGESVTDPAKYYRNNVEGGLSLLRAMRASGAPHLVFSSTAAVYGEPSKLPIEEEDDARPTSPYGETKLAFERALGWHAAASDLRYVSLRYFNAAGASERCGERHDPETHLIPLVLEAAAGRRPDVTILGTDYPTEDGTCVRDYVHVIDLARAHVLALEALEAGRGNGARGVIYNLGCGGGGYSVRQVIDVAREVTGRDIPVRYGPRRPGDPPVLLASAARIERELGWRPQHQDLRAIISSAWAWMLRVGSPLP